MSNTTEVEDNQVNGNLDSMSQPHVGGNTRPTTNGHSHVNGDTDNLNHGELDSQTQNVYEPIAIVGMALRLPGGIRDTEAFWNLIMNKETTRCLIPEDRYNVEAFYTPSKRVGSVGMKHGHFLQENLEHIDTSFFTMSQAEIGKVDPQQRMLLEVVWECMESAGQTQWRGTDIGVFVGCWGEDWIDMAAKDTQRAGVYDITGFGDFAISNRVSYEYDLNGPSVTVRTACSSSTTALHEACVAIQTGNCSSAVVGGTNIILTPTMTTTQTESGVLSPTGECRTFDASANGYARGEAINALYIKKLSDAMRDGDPVRAIIRSSGTNCDGRSKGITMPNPKAHEQLIRKVYLQAGLAFSDTPFVECHGTGTLAGDPVELEAIAKVFGGEKGVYVGGAKPNVGHSEGASGITSIIKATLALENRIIPPQANFLTPNPKIPFEENNLRVPTQPITWPENEKERISVNSFGVGGANAHVVLDSAASVGVQKFENSSRTARPHLLVYSATNVESLKQNAAAIEEYAQKHTNEMESLAHTLANKRDHLASRGFSIIDAEGKFEAMTSAKSKIAPQLVFVFTGQGAQWPGMAKELMRDFPSFDADVKAMSEILASIPNPPLWSIYEELGKSGGESSLDKAEFAQPLCTVIQVALVNLLRSLGITPSAVTGHSSGEIAAAYAAGALTMKEALLTAFYRGLVSTQSIRQGAMAAVGMSKAEVSLYLERGVVVACENSPASVTLSGDVDVLDEVLEQLKFDDPEVFARKLKTGGMAYHSHHMKDLGDMYEGYLAEYVQARKPQLPFFSSVTAGLAVDMELGPAYWRRNLESPVQFFPAVKTLLDSREEDQLFLEIGPHSALSGPLRQIFKTNVSKADLTYASTMIRGDDCAVSFLKAVGQLHIRSIPVNFAPLTPDGRTLTNLPRYAWRHDKCYWDESRVSREWRFRKHRHHEILGNRILEGNDLQPTWRNVLRLKDVPWIKDHKVLDDIVFPAAGYIAMACEAARQVSGAETFSLTHVDIHTALVLQETQTVEMITTLMPVRLTSTLESEWFEFTVSSYDGKTWVKHVAGTIRPGTDVNCEPKFKQPQAYPRIVQSPYAAMKKMGLNYGPTFQGLETVTAYPGKAMANATLKAPEEHECHYALHPSTIDNCLQLFAFAASEGLMRQMDKLCVPTHFDHIYIDTRKGGEVMTARAEISGGRSKATLQGSAMITSGAKVLFELKGGQFSPLDNSDSMKDADTVAAARLEWAPDMDFLDPASLMLQLSNDPKAIQEIEKYTILSMLEMQDLLAEVKFETEHLIKYQQWLDDQLNKAREGLHQLVDDDAKMTRLTREDRNTLLETMTEELKSSELAAGAELIDRLRRNTVGIFDGTTEALEVYLADDGLTNVYNIMADRLDSVGFMKACGHNNPNLRVLEIGAGTGGTTVVALNGLSTDNNERLYSKYTYTDISSGFFGTAQQRFSTYQGLEYKVLDIGRDPEEQGFECGSYDLIIASNVIHATPSLNTTLKNVRKLLQPYGRFFLQELLPSAPQFMHLIMGVLPGWWLGEADNRPNEPIVSIPRWNEELQAAGFAEIEAVVYDDERDGFHICANIIARPAKTQNQHYKAVTLLFQEEFRDSSITNGIRRSLTEHGFEVDDCVFGDLPRSSQDIISLLDLESPFIDDIKEKEFEQFKVLLDGIGTSGILWLTKNVQMGCDEPQHSLFLGLARTVRNELSIPLATLEIDDVDLNACEAVVKVFGKFQERDVSGVVDPDFEYALHQGTIHVGRYHWIDTNDELAKVPTDDKEHAVKLEIGQRGLLNTLRWVQYPLDPLGPDDVLVDPRYAGINFKDILVTMGIVDDEGAGLGLEGSGIVRAVGTNVTHLKPGDRYMTMGITNMSTRKVGLAEHFVKIPDALSFEDAATMPCVYSTIIYSLLWEARIRKGMSILVHSGCGGVGIAAINLCKHVGLEIYATVGSEEKVAYLRDTFGIPRSHIFHSRDASFLPDVLRETGGKGVDVLLNSLSGELLHASWKCIAPRGKMIEIGRRDFNGRAQLNMDLFEGNRGFIGVNLAALADLYGELLRETVRLYEAGHIKPIHPVHNFDASEAEEAFRFMQKGQHIGKLVVHIPDNDTDPDIAHNSINVSTTKRPLRLDPSAAYLLAGGVGGLGRAVATYFVECGARHLIFLSRSATSSNTSKDFFIELEAQDCTISAIDGSVAILTDVQKAVALATESGKRLAGVLQLSMVLRDLPLMKMSHEDWRVAIEPKVDGSWNLHKALIELKGNDLDFFVMFSSALGNFGAAHQSNYAAGNTFQDAFVQYRHGLGLPASVLDVGVMGDIGYVSQNLAVENNMRTTGMWFLTEQDLLDALHLSIVTGKVSSSSSHIDTQVSKAQIGIGFRSTKPLIDPSNRVLWKRDKRMSVYRNMEASNTTHAGASGENDELETLLSSIEADPQILDQVTVVEELTKEIGATIYRFMLQPVDELDVHKSLSALGVDSLVTIEIRNWLRRRLGIEVSTLEILSSGGGTIASLGQIAVERLKGRFGLVEAPVIAEMDLKN